jgi:hypothetical protein
MSSFLTRLRAWDRWEPPVQGWGEVVKVVNAPEPVSLSECADEIERLNAENARLREALLATLSTTVHLCNALDVDTYETYIRVKEGKSGKTIARRSVAEIVQAGCDALGEEKK